MENREEELERMIRRMLETLQGVLKADEGRGTLIPSAKTQITENIRDAKELIGE